MGFIKVELPPKSECKCKKPDSQHGKYFGPGTIWRCDLCGQAYKFVESKYYSDQREGDWWTDQWTRAAEYDGPDNRPLPVVPEVEIPRRDRGCFS